MPRLLDLFCGAGGCAVGYNRAGFDTIVGIDINPQPRYPFAFRQMDALEALRFLMMGGAFCGLKLKDFDVIHASPPCQRYCTGSKCRADRGLSHPDLMPPVISLLRRAGRPWVVENVPQAPFGNPVILCGLAFGLNVFRHRGFESSRRLMAPSHPSHAGNKIGIKGFSCVVGHGGGTTKRMRARMKANGHRDDLATWSRAISIDWMSRNELAQSIPPAYTEFIGKQLIDQL